MFSRPALPTRSPLLVLSISAYVLLCSGCRKEAILPATAEVDASMLIRTVPANTIGQEMRPSGALRAWDTLLQQPDHAPAPRPEPEIVICDTLNAPALAARTARGTAAGARGIFAPSL